MVGGRLSSGRVELVLKKVLSFFALLLLLAHGVLYLTSGKED